MYIVLCRIFEYLILRWKWWIGVCGIFWNLIVWEWTLQRHFDFVLWRIFNLRSSSSYLQMTLLKRLSVHLKVTHCAGSVTTVDALQTTHGSNSSCQILTSKKLMIQMRRLFQIAPQINSKYMSAPLLACFWIVMIVLLLF